MPSRGEGLMGYLRLVSMLAMWTFLAGSISAAPPPSGATPSAAAVKPAELTPRRAVAAATGPIIVNWRFKNGTGTVKLTVHPDGQYVFAVDYKRQEPYRILDVDLMLVCADGYTVYVFESKHDVSTVPAGGLRWSRQGTSAALKEHFKCFAAAQASGAGGAWWGGYRLLWAKGGKEKLLKEETQTCEEWANEWSVFASHVGWGQTGGVTPKYCYKLNVS